MRTSLTISLFLIFTSANSQIHNNKLEKNLKYHVTILASDSLEGRRAGTKGEKLAAEYIARLFKKSKISFYNHNKDFYQDFEIFDGYVLDNSSRVKLNEFSLIPDEDIIILPFSALKGQFKGEVSLSLNEKNNFWMIDIAENLRQFSKSPHSDIFSDLRTLVINAQSRGASGIFLYNSSTIQDTLPSTDKFKESVDIPVLYLKSTNSISTLLSSQQPIYIDLSYELSKKHRQARNVVGFINNNKPESVIIGAHFDHLGFGEDGNIMNKAAIGQIHNGADDNASGTAAILELSSILKHKRYKDYNYILIAFSGEELGLLGSKYFVENHDFSIQPIKFMINLDMIGRLSDSTKSITIGGYGTSQDWHQILSSYSKKDLLFKYDSSGTGPSDHTSFYRKNIPVLFYFTGLHTDYHKPSDDALRINYKGILTIIRHITSVINSSNNFKIQFQKTREQQTSTSTRFSVSLGIMPDYSFSGDGVKVDGVSEGKLAQRIGLKSGDILVRLGKSKITSVESYMKALSSFKKGDITELEYSRDGKLITVQIVFQ